MKKLLSVIFIIGFSVPSLATQGWTPVTSEQAEYNRLMHNCAEIAERFTAMGGSSSGSALPGAIFNYLKSVGTPIALKVLKAQIKSGRCPVSYLKDI